MGKTILMLFLYNKIFPNAILFSDSCHQKDDRASQPFCWALLFGHLCCFLGSTAWSLSLYHFESELAGVQGGWKSETFLLFSCRKGTMRQCPSELTFMLSLHLNGKMCFMHATHLMLTKNLDFTGFLRQRPLVCYWRVPDLNAMH